MLENYYCAYVIENGKIIVWGLGKSEKLALEDAKTESKRCGLDIPNFITQECTECLALDVESYGGDGEFCENEEGIIDVTREKFYFEEVLELYRSYKRMKLSYVSHDTYETIEHLAFTLDYLNGEAYFDKETENECTLEGICKFLEFACEDAIEEDKRYKREKFGIY